MEKISIVVPVYNTYKYLQKCLESLVNQTYKEIEILVIDDGSPDNSYEIYKAFAKRDSRVRYIKKENAGVSEARNTGIDNATGELIMFVDSDDWMEENGCEALIKAFQKTNADLVLGDVYCTDEKGRNKEYCKVFSKQFSTKSKEFIEKYQMACLGYAYNPLHVNRSNVSGLGSPWNKLFKLSIIRENNLRFDTYVCGIYDDNLFTLYYLENCKSVAYISKPIYNYVTMSSSLTHGFKRNTIEISRRIFERIEEFIKNTDKPERFYKAYYMYVIRRLSRELDVYYFNKDNNKSPKEIRGELKKNLSEEPYKNAIEYVESNRLMPAHWLVWIGAKLNNPVVIETLYKLRTLIKEIK